MKKISIIFLSLLIFFCMQANLPAEQKAQKTITNYTYDKKHGITPDEADEGGSSSVTVIPSDNNSTSVTADATGAITISLGNNLNDGSGSTWNTGTSSSSVCNPCTDGVCTFGLGLRAYFEFKYETPDTSTTSTAVADGFTFTLVNASNNDTSIRGGVPTTSFSLGELMGYAGPGNTTAGSSTPLANTLDGLGLKPPKMAIEFDTYPNTGSVQYNGCSGNRNDHNYSNHVSVMFWGANPGSSTMCSYYSTAGNSYRQASFDDNVHGAGDGTSSNPYNSAYSGNGSGLGGYYERARSSSTGYNWMEDGAYHRVRIEIIRTPAAYTYQIKVWVDCESCSGSTCTPCTSSEYDYFQDVYNPYTNSSYLPKIDRTVTLSPYYSSLLDTVTYGFTQGTGASTQTITLNNLAVYFPASTISPTSASYAYGAQTGTVTVTTAASSCTWKAHSNSPWITVTDDNVDRTGSGTVTYSIAANSGATRTGYIIIAGQTFTVTQAAGPPSCTLMAGSNILSYNSTNTLTWAVTGTATGASWTSSPGGTCGSPSVSGGTCTTAAQTTAGARTYTLNVSNAAGSSSCSSTFYVGCQGYTVYNNTGSRRDFRITNSSCSRTNNGSAISGTLNTGETVTRYGTSNWSCGSAQGSFGYTDAMNVDIVFSGGDGDCRVNYNSNDTASDR